MEDDGTPPEICGIRHAGIMFYPHVVTGGRSGKVSAACASMSPSGAELEEGSVVFLCDLLGLGAIEAGGEWI